MGKTHRILGIDPALRLAGWGIIEGSAGRFDFVACGVIRPPAADSLAARLNALFGALTVVIEEYRPDEAAVEETFVNANPRSALTLGQARGVCLLAPAAAGLPVAEYPANTIKKTIAGTGHAEKLQMQMMIRMLLPKAGERSPDEADALAAALTHAHHLGARHLAEKVRA